MCAGGMVVTRSPRISGVRSSTPGTAIGFALLISLNFLVCNMSGELSLAARIYRKTFCPSAGYQKRDPAINTASHKVFFWARMNSKQKEPSLCEKLQNCDITTFNGQHTDQIPREENGRATNENATTDPSSRNREPGPFGIASIGDDSRAVLTQRIKEAH
ncbi:hypothetical protein T265_04614 [Opisthorchis viverrini]|uniref:Uncharacterized protein n=1 Tax=Opisthorchis viverrini TaxID=6198 RepID=A0A074ZN72_OPIVI|nr:hypothetical protein T265_04614 [Opisthorchis viverrini]KER28571.1 hypothetical protein T265_04614 [Opisthorchis viverrini]